MKAGGGSTTGGGASNGETKTGDGGSKRGATPTGGLHKGTSSAVGLERDESIGSPTAVNGGVIALIVQPDSSLAIGSGWGGRGVDRVLMDVFRRTRDVVANGSSGVVFKGRWNDRWGAIKLRNRESKDDLVKLRREIRMYHHIRARYPEILGSVIPFMVLGFDDPDSNSIYSRESILIIELVGREIVRDMDKVLWMGCNEGFVRVCGKDESAICEAALRSLRKLHANNLAHGDVSLRNMRVERQRVGKSTEWKVWFVDLGETVELRPDSGLMSFAVDIGECSSLFSSFNGI